MKDVLIQIIVERERCRNIMTFRRNRKGRLTMVDKMSRQVVAGENPEVLGLRV